MNGKILLVDDEQMLLDSLRRELGQQYEVDIASSGAEGLEKITALGPYALIVSDFRMPKMDGIKFLTQAMQVAPDTVRMILTGNADLPTAIEAINQGHIFRFLSKPCNGKQLTQALDAGLRQYELIMAEKELLENTLKESVTMMTEMLAIVNPKAYGRSLRIHQLVAHIVKELHISNGWQYEMAAALSQLGWITFSEQMLNKIENNQPFNAKEALVFSNHPYTASKLIKDIPRLEQVTKIILGQDRSINDLCLEPSIPDAYTVDLGSHILKVCIDYDKYIMEGLLHDQALAMLKSRQNNYLPKILEALSSLRSFKPIPEGWRVKHISIKELEVGMLVLEPIRDLTGKILLKGNTFVTRTNLISLYGLGSDASLGSGLIKVARRERSES